MAELQGTNIAAQIVPFTTDDTYPTHDSSFGKGGYREVATVIERDAIPADRRKQGMLVYVVELTQTYMLKTGITNSDWVLQVGGSGGGSGSALFVDDVSSKILTSGQTSVTSNNLFVMSSLEVELNGLALKEGVLNDYVQIHDSVSGSGITMNAQLPLEVGDSLILKYELYV